MNRDATYLYDGMPETLHLTGSTASTDIDTYTYEFDSRHAGYGDRKGQMVAEVITHHTAIITVEYGGIKSGIIDAYWDMKKNAPVNDIEISLAPIEEVTVSFLKSNPAQVSVHIKGGLPSGCTTFNNIEVTREGTTVNIKVTNQHPKDAVCPAIYTTFEKDVNLGTDFTIATTYTLNVNDYTTTFNY